MSDDRTWDSDSSRGIAFFILRCVAELEAADDSYDHAPLGKILIEGVDAGYEPEEVLSELAKQREKGRIYRARPNRYARV